MQVKFAVMDTILDHLDDTDADLLNDSFTDYAFPNTTKKRKAELKQTILQILQEGVAKAFSDPQEIMPTWEEIEAYIEWAFPVEDFYPMP